jgi:anti-sigma-K factor RskA
MLAEAPVTHAEFLEQVEAYALGALEPDQARAMAAHLAEAGGHPECEAALRRAQATVAALASGLPPVEPPARVWRALAGSLGEAPGSAGRARPPRGVPGWVYGVAAAALLLLVLGVLRFQAVSSSEALARAKAAECARELADAHLDLLRKEDALKLLVEPGTQVVSLAPSPGPAPAHPGTGVVLFHPRGRTLLIGQRFAADPTRDYELWLIRDGRPVAAGLLPASPDGQVFTDVRPELLARGRPAAFAISVEKKGGETDVPKGPVILSGALAPP